MEQNVAVIDLAVLERFQKTVVGVTPVTYVMPIELLW